MYCQTGLLKITGGQTISWESAQRRYGVEFSKLFVYSYFIKLEGNNARNSNLMLVVKLIEHNVNIVRMCQSCSANPKSMLFSCTHMCIAEHGKQGN